MRKNARLIIKYALGLSLALIAVTNCFDVLSNSSIRIAAPADEPGQANRPRPLRLESGRSGFFDADRTVAGLSPVDLIKPASTPSTLASPLDPMITATKSHAVAPGDTQADPGDTLTYTVVITNSGTSDATGVNFSDTIDSNTTLVAGSLAVSPIAADDGYNTIGNVNISVPAGAGVISNDSNPNGAGTLSVTKLNSVAVPSGGSATDSTAHGSVTLGSDGSFTYSPNAGDRAATDSFQYTLDNGTGKIDTATVTISLSGLIWFVDNTPGPAGDGRLNTPFRALTGAGSFDAGASDAPGDVIFIYTGTGDYIGGLTLLSGQRMIGQGAGQSIEAITGFSTPSGDTVLPATGGANPAITSAANGVNLGSNNEIWGLTFGSTTGADISGSGFGTLKVRDTTLNGDGQALNLTSSGTLDAVFQSISSANSASAAVNLSAVGGSLSSPATTISNSAGIGIQIQNCGPGTGFDFGSTAVNSAGNTSISLTGNSVGVEFSSLNVTPDAGVRGLLATENSGLITTASGAINTAGAAAVEVSRTSGTTPLNITLTSVSANGGNNGIVLGNTSGSFTITGDGTNTSNGSGGTIQNMTTGANGAVAGRGISLSNAQNVSLTAVNLHDFSNFAIRGTTVTGFTLDHSIISGVNGNAAGANDEAAISFDNLLGSAAISNSEINNGFEFLVKVANNSGTLDRLTMDGNSYGSNDPTLGGDAVQVAASNTAVVNVTVTNSTFTNAHEDLFNAAASQTSSMDLVFRNNKLSNSNPSVAATADSVILFSTSTGTVSYDVSCNNMRDADGAAIAVAKGVPASGSGGAMTGSIVNNRIGVSGSPDSGSKSASGIFVSSLGTGVHTTRIADNIIRQYNEAGIFLRANDGSSTLNATVTGNTAAEPGAFAFAGLHAENGALGTDTNVTNVVIGDFNTASLQNDFTDGDPFDFSDVDLLGLGSATAALNLSKAGSPSATVTGVVQDDNVGTPSVNEFQVNLVNTLPATPPVVAGCTPPISPLVRRSGMTPAARGKTPADDGLEAGRADQPKRILRATGGERHQDNFQELRQQDLNWLARAAIQRWKDAGVSGEDLARLEGATFEVVDLPDGQIAATDGTSILVDAIAAGYGWFVDSTPEEDSEFEVPVAGRELQTTELSPGNERVDLLTVLMRQLGCIYIEGKSRVPVYLAPLVQPTLSPSVRRMPAFHFLEPSTPRNGGASGGRTSVGRVGMEKARPGFGFSISTNPPRPAMFNLREGAASGSHGRVARRLSYAPNPRSFGVFGFSGETVTKNIGTIPAGESVTIMFQVTINNPFPNGVCEVANLAHITGTNFSPVDTNSDVVTVVAPVVIGACPANIVANTDPGLCTAVVAYSTPTASGCPEPTVTCDPPSGFAFSKGTTTVTCTATNGNPPDSTCSFTVTVNDNQPPVIGACPANIVTDEDPPGSGSATVTYATPGSSDNCPGQVVNCSPASGSSFPVGTTTVTCTALDTSGNSASCQFTVTVNSVGLTALSPAQVWIGLKNSDDVGTKFDLLAEVLKNGSVVGSGELDDVPGGSSGFNNAALRTITLALGSSVGIGSGDTLSFRLSVRIAATSGHANGTARLWYNGAAIDSGPGHDAGSRFDATIAGSSSDYFLRTGFLLNTTAGSSRTFVDKLVSTSGGNPWVPFGTWSVTL